MCSTSFSLRARMGNAGRVELQGATRVGRIRIYRNGMEHMEHVEQTQQLSADQLVTVVPRLGPTRGTTRRHGTDRRRWYLLGASGRG